MWSVSPCHLCLHLGWSSPGAMSLSLSVSSHAEQESEFLQCSSKGSCKSLVREIPLLSQAYQSAYGKLGSAYSVYHKVFWDAEMLETYVLPCPQPPTELGLCPDSPCSFLLYLTTITGSCFSKGRLLGKEWAPDCSCLSLVL